ncbi:DUF5080 family protein, partial [Staphylococcus pasteuri]|uniref:DUF5080 family protein n=3 Tax=Staphylococcus TaxID=1279 RepID=UPI0034C62875
FIIFYLVLFDALLKSEGISILSVILDIIIIVMLIIVYIIGRKLSGNDLSNYIAFTLIGSYIYMYYAVKNFWIKPKLVKYLVGKKLQEEEEDLEYQKLDIQTSRTKSKYYGAVAILLLVFTKIYITPDLKEDSLSTVSIFIPIGIIIILIWLILDLYRKKQFGIFFFKSLIPMVVTVWIFVSIVILI